MLNFIRSILKNLVALCVLGYSSLSFATEFEIGLDLGAVVYPSGENIKFGINNPTSRKISSIVEDFFNDYNAHYAFTGALKFTNYFNEYFGIISSLRTDIGSSGSRFIKATNVPVIVSRAVQLVTLQLESKTRSWQIALDTLFTFKFPMKNNKLRFTAALGPVISFNKYSDELLLNVINHTTSRSTQDDIEVSYRAIDAMVNLGMEYDVNENFCIRVFVGANSKGLCSFSEKMDIGALPVNPDSYKVKSIMGIRGGIGLSYKL